MNNKASQSHPACAGHKETSASWRMKLSVFVSSWHKKNNWERCLIKYSAAILLAIVLFSCKTTRFFNSGITKQMDVLQIYDSVAANYLDYKTLSIKFSSEITTPKKQFSLSGAMRIKKDSVIWISVTAMGIEVARVLFTPDSVKITDRINATYYTGNYDYINNIMNSELNFPVIRSIFTGEIFTMPYRDNCRQSLAGFTSLNDSARYVLQNYPAKENSVAPQVKQRWCILPNPFKVNEVSLSDEKLNRYLLLKYLNFEAVNGKQFPNDIDLEVKNNNDSTKVTLKYSKITVDKEMNYPFTIPANFERMKQGK